MNFFLSSLITLLVVKALDSASTNGTSCPNLTFLTRRPSYYSMDNEICFVFFTDLWVEYEVALEYCKFHGGTLAMPKTKSLNNILLQEMKKHTFYGSMWIGMTDKKEEGIWIWEDGSLADLSKSRVSFYDGFFKGGHDCMALDSRDGLWHDETCSRWWSKTDLPFICQYRVKVTRPKEDDIGLRGSNKTYDFKAQDIFVSKPARKDDAADNNSDDNQDPKSKDFDVQSPRDKNVHVHGPRDKGIDFNNPGDTGVDVQGTKNKTVDVQDTGNKYIDVQDTGDKDSDVQNPESKDGDVQKPKGTDIDVHDTTDKAVEKDTGNKDIEDQDTKNKTVDVQDTGDEDDDVQDTGDKVIEVQESKNKTEDVQITGDNDIDIRDKGDTDEATKILEEDNDDAMKIKGDKAEAIIIQEDMDGAIKIKEDMADVKVIDDSCPSFHCPGLDCDMNGFRIQNGCHICECNQES